MVQGAELDYVTEFSRSRGIPIDFLRRLNFTATADGALLYDWTGPEPGQTAVLARRRLPKGAERRFDWNKPKDAEAPNYPFAFQPLWADLKELDTLLIVEGETDVLTAAVLDIPALGVPGSHAWKPEYWRYAKNFTRVVVVVEPDFGGVSLLEKVAASVPHDYNGGLYAVTFGFHPWHQKDLNDLYVNEAHNNPDSALDLLNSIPAHPVTSAYSLEEALSLVAQRLQNSRIEGEDRKAICPFHPDTDGNLDFGPKGVRCFNPGCIISKGGIGAFKPDPRKDGYGPGHIRLLAAMLGIVLAENTENAAKLIPIHEFLSLNIPKPEYLLDGVLFRGGLAVLGGRRKEGKSYLALHLCRAIAQGEDFLSIPTMKAPCVYLNFEMDPRTFQHLYAIPVLGPLARTNAPMYLMHPEALLSPREPQEDAAAFVNRMSRLLEGIEEPGLIVIDTARGAFRMRGESERISGDVGAILRDALMTFCRSTGWCVLLVHHFRKGASGDAEDLSGSGEWLDAPDVYLIWTAKRKTEEYILGELKIDGRVPPRDNITFKLSPTSITVDEGIVDFQEAVKQLTNEQMLLLTWINRLGKATTGELATKSGLSLRTVHRYVKQLERMALIYKAPVDKDGRGRKGTEWAAYPPPHTS